MRAAVSPGPILLAVLCAALASCDFPVRTLVSQPLSGEDAGPSDSGGGDAVDAVADGRDAGPAEVAVGPVDAVETAGGGPDAEPPPDLVVVFEAVDPRVVPAGGSSPVVFRVWDATAGHPVAGAHVLLHLTPLDGGDGQVSLASVFVGADGGGGVSVLAGTISPAVYHLEAALVGQGVSAVLTVQVERVSAEDGDGDGRLDGSDCAPRDPRFGESCACRVTQSWEVYPAGPRLCRRFEYDSRGREVLVSRDTECDGGNDRCSRTEWDAEGRRTAHFQDADCDGTADGLCREWRYSGGDREVTETEDYDCDGCPEVARWRTLDEQARTVAERIVFSCAADQAAVSCYEYAFDEHGNATETRLDEECDGTWEWCQGETFDAAGQWTGSYMDLPCDGVPDDNCRTVTTVATGEGGSDQTQRLDSTCDGAELTCWRTVKDARGQETFHEVDHGCDGAGESCRAREYDALGSLIRATLAEPCAAEPRVCAVAWTLDEAGREVSSQQDLGSLDGEQGCTGTPWYCVTTTWDAAGRPLVVTTDAACDGTSPSCQVFTYDDHGNQLAHRTESPCGGDSVSEERAEFACPVAP